MIVGGGHAAGQLCAGLVEAGLAARVYLVCEEAELPYHRPPLSKTFIKNAQEPLQLLRGRAWYAKWGIDVHSADAAVAIDRAERRLHLRSGAVLGYERLVLATGTRARCLPGLASDLANVSVLRSADDAARLRRQLGPVSTITVIGGGFIGLEIAASAVAMGKQVTVLEAAPRLLMRSLSTALSEHVLQMHRAAGIEIHLGVAVDGFDIEGGRLTSLQVNGERQRVELAILGIGAEPEQQLARAAGLECDPTAQSFRKSIAVGACAWSRCRTQTITPVLPWPLCRAARNPTAHRPGSGLTRAACVCKLRGSSQSTHSAIAGLVQIQNRFRYCTMRMIDSHVWNP